MLEISDENASQNHHLRKKSQRESTELLSTISQANVDTDSPK